MSGQDLYTELDKKVKALNTALSEYRKRGIAFAQAEHNYRIALAKGILIQRAEGLPVTIIQDICKGEEGIAKLRLNRDIAETLYKSAGEAIQSYKLQIRILESEISREYSSVGYT